MKESQKSTPQECPTRVSHENLPEESTTRVVYKSVFYKSTRVSNNVWLFVFECMCAFGFVGSVLVDPDASPTKKIQARHHILNALFRPDKKEDTAYIQYILCVYIYRERETTGIYIYM